MSNLKRCFETTPLNLIGARILQVGAGSVILYRILTELHFAQFLYGPYGASIGSSTTFFGPYIGAVLDAIFYSSTGIYLLLALWGLGAIGLIAGRYPRLSALLALFGYLLIESRANIGDGGDNVLRLVLLYMVFLHPKLATPQQIKPGSSVFLHNLAVVAVYLQLMILYFIAGTAKLQGEVWINGTALYYVMHTDWFGPGQPWLRDLFKNPWIVTLGTYCAVLYQIGFPFMIFSRWQLLWIAIGIAFHLGIAATMGLITFSTILIAMILFTIRDTQWIAVRDHLRRYIPRLTVYIDGYCSYCRATGRWLEFLDLFGSLKVESFRHTENYKRFGISPKELEEEMHVVTFRHDEMRVYRGFAAVQVIVRAVPFLWGLWPLAWALRQAGLGDPAYRWLAARRLLAPDSQHCQSGSCAIVNADARGGPEREFQPPSVSSSSKD
ncbi:MAG: DUF393 domain-containing protein [Dethiobacter sp.]|nr:DUF393 domain-containing protein [Dethiobacter sp.]